MRLESSPMLDGSSSGGEGSAVSQQTQVLQLHQQPPQRKDKSGSKKSRLSPSLGYAETRYFILKGLNEEDLKLSVQYGLWATQEHLVPILNDAYAVNDIAKDVVCRVRRSICVLIPRFLIIYLHVHTLSQNSKDVYLVFSANKSGEFFGYAR